MPCLRLLAVPFAAALVSLAPTAQGAPKTKPVEVVNFPDPQNVTGSVEVLNLPEVQDVNVVNTPPTVPAACSRFHLVGFTASRHTGDLGGVFGATAICQAEFGPEARFCNTEEAASTTDLPQFSAAVAWVQPTPFWS